MGTFFSFPIPNMNNLFPKNKLHVLKLSIMKFINKVLSSLFLSNNSELKN